MSSIIIRNASISDTDSLINLRKILLNQGTAHYSSKNPEEDLAWQDNYREWLKKHLNINPNIKVIVSCRETDKEDLLGCAIGIIDERVPFNGCLNGRMGWVQTVVVQFEHRKKGLAEKMMLDLFDWFQANETRKVALQTTEIAKGLYKKLKFYDSGEPFLIKNL